MNDTPNSAKFHLVARDDGGGGLSTGTIIVIAVVCGCVAILVLALFLWRLLLRCCRTKESAPLPPVQELAHHRREQHRAAFPAEFAAPSRPTTWSVPPTGTPYTGSSVSLLTSRDKNASTFADELGTTESYSPSPIDDNKLYPPNPSFYRSPDASSSRHTLDDNASSSQSSLRSAVSPSPTIPIPESGPNGSQSQFSIIAQSQSRPGSLSRPTSSYSRRFVSSAAFRTRPLSQISDSPTTYSGFTVRSSSTVRGAPHRPGNNIQIVLPAPLAVNALEGDSVLYTHHQHSRSSMFADQWLSTSATNSQRTSVDNRGDERRTLSKSRSRSGQRQAASVPHVSQSRSPPSTARRAASQHSRSRSKLRKNRPESSLEPEMPTQYGNLADLAEAEYESDAGRGRSRTSPRLQTIESGQVSHYPPLRATPEHHAS